MRARLKQIGLSYFDHSSPDVVLPEIESTLLLYDVPHNLLTLDSEPLSIDQVLNGYRSLLRLSFGAGRLVAIGRLASLTDELLIQWLTKETPFRTSHTPEFPPAMVALLTRTILDSCPDLLNAYLDLELKADLGGDIPDSAYLSRLSSDLQTADPEELLAAWREPLFAAKSKDQIVIELEETLKSRDQSLTECRGSLETLQLQNEEAYKHLAQVRQELENIFQDNQRLQVIANEAQEKDKELALKARDLDLAHQEIAQINDKAKKLHAQCAEDKHQLELAQEENQRTTSHLQELQVELERYFQDNQRLQVIANEAQEKDKELALRARDLDLAHQEIAQINDKAKKLHAQCAEDKHQLELAQEENQRTTSHLQELQVELERYFQDNQRLQVIANEAQEKDKELALRARDLDLAHQEIAQINDKAKKLHAQCAEDKHQLELAQEENQRTTSHLQELQVELERYFQDNQRLQVITNEAQEKDKELALRARDLDLAHQEIAQINDKAKKLRAQCAEDKHQLELAQEENQRTTSHLHAVQIELDRYFQENQRYQALEAEFQKQISRAEVLLLSS